MKGRDRYIVVKKEGSEYTLKKLLKTSLRDKEYVLKSTEIYPVCSNVLQNESYLRGWEDTVDDDEENEVRFDDEQLGQPINIPDEEQHEQPTHS